MRLMETQSKRTLANWAVAYAKAYYLPVFEAECPEERCLAETVAACESYGKGQTSLNELKPLLREAAQVARALADRPVAQAAARAVSVACSTVQTPTNALGYLFYGPRPSHTARPVWIGPRGVRRAGRCGVPKGLRLFAKGLHTGRTPSGETALELLIGTLWPPVNFCISAF